MSKPIPLETMTYRRLCVLSPDEQRAYWDRVFALWKRNLETAKQREHQADYNDTRRDGDWA